jgi:hypothetical protein
LEREIDEEPHVALGRRLVAGELSLEDAARTAGRPPAQLAAALEALRI